jgi:hypothetical protein
VKSGEEPEHREHDDIQGMHDHLDAAFGGEQDGEEPDADDSEQREGKGLGELY